MLRNFETFWRSWSRLDSVTVFWFARPATSFSNKFLQCAALRIHPLPEIDGVRIHYQEQGGERRWSCFTVYSCNYSGRLSRPLSQIFASLPLTSKARVSGKPDGDYTRRAQGSGRHLPIIKNRKAGMGIRGGEVAPTLLCKSSAS